MRIGAPARGRQAVATGDQRPEPTGAADAALARLALSVIADETLPRVQAALRRAYDLGVAEGERRRG